jgi:ABC-2 type transport system ATP-binding protein
LLNFTSLQPFVERLAGKLSGGMKQKLGLACALLGDPQFLLLDEPGVGVDPVSRRDLMKMVRNLNKNNMTVLWSTSYLDEAEGFDKVILLNNGDILYNGDPADLTKTMDGAVFNLNIKNYDARNLTRRILRSPKKIIDVVIEAKNIRIVSRDESIKRRFAQHLTSIKPRFEDAVIEKLGGITMGESKLAQALNITKDVEYVVEAKKLTKKFGDFTAAHDISFQIRKGEIFGLLGPNGAGKSTSFRMMCGLSKPTFGEGYIIGINMQNNPEEARSNLGYMAQKFSLVSSLSVKQNMTFFSGIYGLSGKKRENRINEVAEIFDLKQYFDMPSGTLPLGFKQRLSLACAIMHNPSVLFLDEPTSGVDPLTRREFWKHINAMVEKGVTVMVTTHFMDEAEFCDRIALIYKGEAIKVGSPSDIKKDNETMEDAFVRTILEYDKGKI